MTATKSPLDVAADLIDPPDDDWVPLPHQIPPAGNYFVWLLMGGRGAGKTAAAARDMHNHVHGPPCLSNVPGGHWPAIIAPTLGDGVTSCVNGPSGLRQHCPDVKLRTNTGGTLVRWPNGTEAKIFGAHNPEDVERLRSGGNRCYVWAEELAAWRYLEECWQHMRYGLRLGPWPHVVASTTPKPRKLIKELVRADNVVITKATTDDNPHLHPDVKAALYEDYGGTRLGRQELYAELLEDFPGALWDYDTITDNRITIPAMPDWFDRMAIGVDPAVTVAGDETGIIVAAVLPPYEYTVNPETEHRRHGFVLADYSKNDSPTGWAREVITAFREWEANIVIAEVNNGGDLVAHTIRTIDGSIPIKAVHASRGKAKRAEPVSALYQQGLIHHVGEFPELEEQMTSWDSLEPDESWSPDRMDAMVWAFTELMVTPKTLRRQQARDTRLRGRR